MNSSAKEVYATSPPAGILRAAGRKSFGTNQRSIVEMEEKPMVAKARDL
jgi:hypothetical protein